MITANEMADLLETNYTRASVMEAADKLRQQQAEIEALRTFDGGQTICPSCGCKSLYKTNRSEWCVTHKCLWQADYDLELTDEEIHKLWLECWDEIEFARAILKKAQEK